MRKIISGALFLIAFSLSAQDFDRAKMDSLFSAIEENQKGMGSIAISKEGEVIYQNSIGFSDLANKVRNTENTKFRIGSISKTFTAAIVMQLVEEGKLQMGTKLSEFFPDVPNASEITIEDLLRHQSGLFNFTNKEEYLEYMEEPKTREELLEIIKENGTVFQPGEKNEYSNTNYVLLSFIAEDVENADFKEILKRRISEPLGLNNTYLGGKIGTQESEALSYTKNGDWVLGTETDMSIPMGAGGIVSTPTDLTKFFTALFNGEVVKPESLEQMKTIKNGYGIGLFSYPFNEKTFYGHTGGIDGFSSIAVYNPEEDLSVAYIANASEISNNDLIIGVLSTYFGIESAIPVFAPAIDVSEEELQKYTGTYSMKGESFKLDIFIENKSLLGQATGQSSFPLEPYDKNKFQFVPAGIKIEFSPEDNKLTLRQGGAVLEMIRE